VPRLVTPTKLLLYSATLGMLISSGILTLKLIILFSSDEIFVIIALEFVDRLIVAVEQGRFTGVALDIINGIINVQLKLMYFFYCKLVSRGEIAKVYLFPSYNLIDSRGEILTYLNNIPPYVTGHIP
jgi:hypothetical protein